MLRQVGPKWLFASLLSLGHFLMAAVARAAAEIIVYFPRSANANKNDGGDEC